VIYQLLIRLLLPIVALFLLFTGRNNLRFVKQRLGFGYQKKLTEIHPIWIHCASVGEVKAIEHLVSHLAQKQPILITTNTTTGKELVDSLFSSLPVQHQYCPYDLPIFIQNFLKLNQPSECWIIETEIWPNLFKSCYKANIAVKILNGRLSKKTLTAPNWLKNTYKSTLKLVSIVITRNQTEADNFEKLGVNKENIQILGNLKYAGLADIKPQKSSIQQPFVLLASSHATEEFQIIQLWKKLNRNELLIIVPRHPKRSQSIVEELKNDRKQLAVFSLKEPITPNIKYYLIDAIDQLMPLFSDAKLVIMGGSFVEKGGHNILEPAAVQAAIITGKDMSDFEQETELLKNNQGLIQVCHFKELKNTLNKILDDEQALKKLGKNARRAVFSQKNIFKDYLKALS
jgi:3-deoxy-D-manno-octulosonic-acid transferase